MKVGDLVKFKKSCRPTWAIMMKQSVFLVSRISGGFIGLHNQYEHGLFAKVNFDSVRKANENR
jgi:hypothetical protein